MERELIVLNIERFKRLLESELDERTRETVLTLLAEAQADLQKHDWEKSKE
jgi:hypothetical protein